eukprot:8801837-Alexandrium_andersonii.AAC.1
MRRRDSNPAEGGRALKNRSGTDDIAVYCFSARGKGYAWSSHARAMRLTSHGTRWRVCIEGVSCAARVDNFHKRGNNTQVTIPDGDFHITAILIK